MRKNETTASKRIVGPIPFYDADGNLKSGLTFNGAGECQFGYIGAAFADTTNDPVEYGTTGMYYVQLEQSETNHDTVIIVKLTKATYRDHFERVPIDNTPDVNVVSEALGLATSTDVGDAETAILAALDAIAADLLAIGGLLHRNSMVDGGAGQPGPSYDANGNLLSARVRVFINAAALASATLGAADDVDEEVYRFTLTGTAASQKMASFQARQVL